MVGQETAEYDVTGIRIENIYDTTMYYLAVSFIEENHIFLNIQPPRPRLVYRSWHLELAV